MFWSSKKKTDPTTLKDVWAHLNEFYRLPSYQAFTFANAKGNAFKESRRTELLTFGIEDNPLPHEPQTYSRVCEIVRNRYRDTIPELDAVKVWDSVRKEYVPGMTQIPKS